MTEKERKTSITCQRKRGRQAHSYECHSIKMKATPLTTALSELLACDPKQLTEYFNNPFVISKVTEYLKGKRLETTYLDKSGVKKEITFGNISLKAVCDTDAFEGYLGVKLHQYFYVKYRIRLLYPKLRSVVEYQKGHNKYYPIELLAILEEEEPKSDPTDSLLLDES